MKKNLGLLFESFKLVESVEEIAPAQNDIIDEFIDFVFNKLGIKKEPKIELLNQRKEGMTYGAYNPGNGTVYVLAVGRGLADILRTLAHELVHYSQDENGRIPKDLKGRNKELEDDANSRAADFVYMFGLDHPEIYETTF
jgi:hypothetical protein